jgi:hypothetical protein
MGLNKLLSYQGRLILVNSILSALATFYMCTFKMPMSILEQVDKYRKHYFWNRCDVNKKGGCLVAWKMPPDQRIREDWGSLISEPTTLLFY